MTASLQGKFIKDENMVKFEHVNDFGNSQTSLIDSVAIHQITHAVRADFPNDDGKPDFLADDVDDPDFLPETLYNSEGSTAIINVSSNPMINGKISTSNPSVTLTGNAPNGWVYIRVNDPGEEKFVLKQVVRSDGKEIRMNDNAWATHRTIRLIDYPPYRQNLVHIFDYISTGSYSYTLTYETPLDTPKPPVLMFVPDRSMVEGIHFGFIVKASDPNGTIPKLSATPIPKTATFTDKGNGEGIFDWATATGDAGKYEMTFTASDGELTASRKAIVTIYSANDSDKDTLPDEWEMENFGTLAKDGTADSDNDGVSDMNEYLNNTDPLKTSYYNLTINIEPAGKGTVTPVTGTYLYPENQVVNITANADTGYKFDHWTGDVANPSSASTTVTMNAIKAVTAHFAILQTAIQIVTAEIGDVTSDSALCGGNVISDGGSPVIERGVCWSEATPPTLEDNRLTDTSSGLGQFSITLRGLNSGAIYYVRAYAKNSKGTSYGTVKRFTAIPATHSISVDIDGNGTTDLRDVIFALRIVSGTAPGTTVQKAADMSGDRKIGIEEAILALKAVSERAEKD